VSLPRAFSPVKLLTTASRRFEHKPQGTLSTREKITHVEIGALYCLLLLPSFLFFFAKTIFSSSRAAKTHGYYWTQFLQQSGNATLFGKNKYQNLRWRGGGSPYQERERRNLFKRGGKRRREVVKIIQEGGRRSTFVATKQKRKKPTKRRDLSIFHHRKTGQTISSSLVKARLRQLTLWALFGTCTSILSHKMPSLLLIGRSQTVECILSPRWGQLSPLHRQPNDLLTLWLLARLFRFWAFEEDLSLKRFSPSISWSQSGPHHFMWTSAKSGCASDQHHSWHLQ